MTDIEKIKNGICPQCDNSGYFLRSNGKIPASLPYASMPDEIPNRIALRHDTEKLIECSCGILKKSAQKNN